MDVILVPNGYTTGSFPEIRAKPIESSYTSKDLPIILAGCREFVKPEKVSDDDFRKGMEKWLTIPRVNLGFDNIDPFTIYCGIGGQPLAEFYRNDGWICNCASDIIAVQTWMKSDRVRIQGYWVEMDRANDQGIARIKCRTIFDGDLKPDKFRCNHCGEIINYEQIENHPCPIYEKKSHKLRPDALTIADVSLEGPASVFKDAVMTAMTFVSRGLYRGYEDMF